jgi:lysophospholipase L1-like esterase
MKYRHVAVALALLALPTSNATSRATNVWTASWAAAPAPPLSAAPGVPADALSRAFDNQTVDQIVRLSVGGDGLRLRLTNEYGTKPLRVGAAHVALVDPSGVVIRGTDRSVTFSGNNDAVIPAGAPWVSDRIGLQLPARSRLRISLFFPEDTGLCTCHASGNQTAMVSPAGNFAGQAFVPAATFSARAFISEVDVSGPTAKPVIVAFGDSITDGYKSSIDQDRRWTDRLVERLAADRRYADHSVVNAAISGNRVLTDGAIALFGQSAVARFDRDVLSVPGVTTVILLEGVNDIGQARKTPIDAKTLIEGYRQLIARAHARGIRIIGATLLPYKGAAYFTPAGDAVRTAVNRWILTAGAFDGVIDFDAAMRDPGEPNRMRPDLQSGDWLHPNDSGYRAMGDAVPLSMLQ